GNHEEMHRRGRVDVVESHDVVVLVEFLRRDLARDDLAENAVAHRTALMPCCGNSSRRCRRCPRGAGTRPPRPRPTDPDGSAAPANETTDPRPRARGAGGRHPWRP